MSYSRRRKLAAWGVHAYTALGLPLAFLSSAALFQQDVQLFFALNCVAVFVDATDGALARKVNVKDVLPQFNGRRLDDLVDFIIFAFLPSLALSVFGMFPEGMEWAAVVPLLASGYGFCQERAKTDESFVGFPSYWNIGVLYLYLLQTGPWVNLTTVLVFTALVFVPIHYVYPSRTRMMRPVTVTLGFVWAAVMFGLALNPKAEWAQKVAIYSMAYPLYYLVLSAFNHLRISRDLRDAEEIA